MGVKTFKKEKLRVCWGNSRAFENLGEFFRWVSDYYIPTYMLINTYNVLLEATRQYNIPQSALHRYLKDEVLEELNTEDGVNAAIAWFEMRLKCKDAEYFIFKYAHRKAWDDVVNTLTELILLNTWLSEEESYKYVEAATFNFDDVLDQFPIDSTPTRVRLYSRLRLDL